MLSRYQRFFLEAHVSCKLIEHQRYRYKLGKVHVLNAIVEGKIDLVGFVQFSSQDTLNKLPQQTRTELDSLPERLGVCLSNE